MKANTITRPRGYARGGSSYASRGAASLVAALLLALSSCGNIFVQGNTGAASGAGAGNLTLKIPALASWVVDSMKTPKSGSARALAAATSVKIEVKKAGGGDAITPVTTAVSYMGSGSQISVTVPAGTGYTVKVSVYNSAVSSATPVVEGTAINVDVGDVAPTTVAVTCLPVAPTAASAPSLIDPTMASMAERWYSMAVTSGVTYYFTQTSPAYAFAIFDSVGNLIDHSTYIAYTASGDGSIYFALINTDASAGAAHLTVATTLPPLNEGSAVGPVGLSPNSDHTFIIGPSADSAQNTSYYSFTTGDAGDYALDTPAGYFTATLYSDSGFSSALSTQAGNYFGWTMNGLAAATTYYLKLENPAPDFTSFSGRIMDPSAIAAANDSQGSVAVPQALTLDSAFAARIGGRVYDRTSTYTFTTGPGSDYTISASGISPSSLLSFDVYTEAAEYLCSGSVVGASGSMSILPLSAASTYYLFAYNNNASGGAVGFDLEVQTASTPTFTALPADGSWTAGSLPSRGSARWYVATVAENTSYTLRCDSGTDGSGAYTAKATVSAFEADRLTPYFANEELTYTTPQTINVPAGQTSLYVCVSDYDEAVLWSGGSFALRLQ
jgi:hypothetical protein